MQQIYIGRDESGNLTRYVLTRQKLEDSSASSVSLSLPPKKLFLRRKQFFDQIALASVPSLINSSSAGRQYPMSMTTSLKPEPISLPHDQIKRVTREFKERFGNIPTEHNWLLSYERLYKSMSKVDMERRHGSQDKLIR